VLDILMAIPVADLPLAVSEFSDGDKFWHEGAIPSLVRDVDVPFRMSVVIDGGTRDDAALLQRYMPTLEDWQLDQNDGVQGIPKTLTAMLTFARNPFIVVVPPNIWVRDPKWFGKMQVVFTKDPHCMMVAADVPETVSATMPPQRLDHKTHPSSPFFLTNNNGARNVLGAGPLLEKAYWREYSLRARDIGGTRWVASSVRYGDSHASAETGTQQPA
jgi:hypothetical protein